MPSWIVKAATQRAIGCLPAPHVWNTLIQKRVSGAYALDEAQFVDKLHRARRHLEACGAGAGGGPPGRVVEIGTGWFPIVPVAFWLRGAEEVLTYDVVRHLDDARLAATLAWFARFRREGRLAAFLDGVDPARADRLDALAQAGPRAEPLRRMEALGLRYRVCDVARAGLSPGSADVVFSTAVLQHLPEAVLTELLRACARILAAGGRASHWIDLADQYAYFDRRITPFNFLRFPEPAWRLINNPIIPNSRLRIGDYRRVFAEAGLRIVAEDPRRGSLADLRRVPLARAFRDQPVMDLRVLDAWIVAVPAAAPGSAGAVRRRPPIGTRADRPAARGGLISATVPGGRA